MYQYPLLLFALLQGAALALTAQPHAAKLPLRDLLNLIPNELAGYDQVGKFKSREIKIGTMSYTVGEKEFSHQRSRVKLLLFDYQDAPVMFEQTTRPWLNTAVVDSDSVKRQRIEWVGNKGWESENTSTQSAQVALAINQRFVLMLIGENCRLSDLYTILGIFDLSRFPK